jgi:hypothetical protein
VDGDQSTVTWLPVLASATTIDDELTEEIAPVAKGRPCAVGRAAAVGDVDDELLELQAPSASAPAPTTAGVSQRLGRRGERRCARFCMYRYSWSGRRSWRFLR